MPFAFAAVMPHGDALIPGVGNPLNGHPSLTAAMRRVARQATELRLDALIVADPHGIALEDVHTITLSRNLAGSLHDLTMEAQIDYELALEVLTAAVGAELPVAGVALEDNETPLPMEWGTIVPAWFFSEQGTLPPLVILCPSRAHSLEEVAALGRTIAAVSEESSKRVGLVASADNAHTHMAEGPYGFHPTAGVFDDLVVRLVRENRFDEILAIDPLLIESSMPDSPWQLAIVAGAFDVVPFRATDVTYECPSYFGMMVAGFERQD